MHTKTSEVILKYESIQNSRFRYGNRHGQRGLYRLTLQNYVLDGQGHLHVLTAPTQWFRDKAPVKQS